MKKIRKLSAILLGSILAIGIGANIGASTNQEVAKAADVTDSMMAKSFGGYTTNSFATKAYSAAGATTGVTYEMNVYNGSTGAIRGNQSAVTGNFMMRNTTTYSGYYISKIKLTVTGGTLDGSTAARSVITYGTSAIAATNTAGVIRSDQTTSGLTTMTWTVASPTTSQYTHFCVNHLKTSGTALAAVAGSIQVTWAQGVTLSNIAVTTNPTKTVYTAGETLNLKGLVVTGTYSDSSTANVTSECTFSPAAGDTLTTSNTSVTVSHAGVSNTSFNITVNPNTVPTIALNKSSLSITEGSNDTVTVTPSNFSGTPTINAFFTSTGTATGTYASASINGMVVTVTGIDAGNDTLTVTGTYGAETDSEPISITINELVTTFTATVSFSGSTGNMTGNNDADLVGLTGKPFTAVSTKGGSNNHIGLNTAGNIRLYYAAGGTGNTLTITLTNATYRITKLDINFGSTVARALVKVDDVQKYNATPTASSTVNITGLSGLAFTIQNVNTTNTQLWINSIVITYELLTGGAVLTEDLSVSGTLTNASQYTGRTLDITGLTIKAVYDNDDEVTLTESQLTLPTLVYGTNSYEISYTEDDITATATINVTVLADSVSALSWTSRVTTFTEGDTFSSVGVIKATYASGGEVTLALTDVTIYVYSGTWDPLTSPTITTSTTLTDYGHNGKTVRLGYSGIYTTTSTLTVVFAPTTTYGSLGANLVTDVANLSVGDSVLILNTEGTYALSTTQNGNNRGAVGVSTSGGVLSTIPETAQIMTLEAGTVANTFAFNTGTAGYLYAASSSENYLRSQTTNDANGSWIISIASSGAATVTAQGTNTRNVLQYNSSLTLFSAYSSGQQDVHIYEITAGGYNYNYLLDVLDGDYCSFDLTSLNTVYTRYNAMTGSEISHFNVATITGLDSNTYTGLEAYTEAMIRRAALQAEETKNTEPVNEVNESLAIIIITIVAFAGVSIIGAYFLSKKRELI